jgi:CRP-like cAMP-binding protein
MSNAPNFPHAQFLKAKNIFRKGDPADKFYIIESGVVEIFDPETKQTIARLTEGDAFGEQAILIGGIRGASATAVEDTVCMEISTTKLRDMLNLEESLLRPTIEALLLQLLMHNEIKTQGASNSTVTPVFHVSERFVSSLLSKEHVNSNKSQVENEFTKEELVQINKEITEQKNKITIKEGQTIAGTYELLKEKAAKALREKKLESEVASASKNNKPPVQSVSLDELSNFLKSEEAKQLPSRDSLYLKLLNNSHLGSTAFAPGQKITSVGDGISTAYIITQGEVSQSSTVTGYATLGPGAVIGLAEGIADAPCITETIARNAVVAITVPVIRCLSAVRGSNSGLMGIARFTAMRILETNIPPKSLSK